MNQIEVEEVFLPHGSGLLEFDLKQEDMKSTFSGRFHRGTRRGLGVQLSANGIEFAGNWKDDMVEGGCVISLGNSMFAGQLRSKMCHGILSLDEDQDFGEFCRQTKLEENFQTATIIHGNFKMVWESGKGLSFKEDEFSEDRSTEASKRTNNSERQKQTDEKDGEGVSGHNFGSVSDLKPGEVENDDFEGTFSTLTDDIETASEISRINSPLISPAKESRGMVSGMSQLFAKLLNQQVEELRQQIYAKNVTEAIKTIRSIRSLVRSEQTLKFENLLSFLSEEMDASEISLVQLPDDILETFQRLKSVMTWASDLNLLEELEGSSEGDIEVHESEESAEQSESEQASQRSAGFADDEDVSEISNLSYHAFSEVDYKHDVRHAFLFTMRDGSRHSRKFQSSDQTVVKWQRYKEIARKAFDVANDAHFEAERGKVKAKKGFNLNEAHKKKRLIANESSADRMEGFILYIESIKSLPFLKDVGTCFWVRIDVFMEENHKRTLIHQCDEIFVRSLSEIHLNSTMSLPLSHSKDCQIIFLHFVRASTASEWKVVGESRTCYPASDSLLEQVVCRIMLSNNELQENNKHVKSETAMSQPKSSALSNMLTSSLERWLKQVYLSMEAFMVEIGTVAVVFLLWRSVVKQTREDFLTSQGIFCSLQRAGGVKEKQRFVGSYLTCSLRREGGESKKETSKSKTWKLQFGKEDVQIESYIHFDITVIFDVLEILKRLQTFYLRLSARLENEFRHSFRDGSTVGEDFRHVVVFNYMILIDSHEIACSTSMNEVTLQYACLANRKVIEQITLTDLPDHSRKFSIKFEIISRHDGLHIERQLSSPEMPLPGTYSREQQRVNLPVFDDESLIDVTIVIEGISLATFVSQANQSKVVCCQLSRSEELLFSSKHFPACSDELWSERYTETVTWRMCREFVRISLSIIDSKSGDESSQYFIGDAKFKLHDVPIGEDVSKLVKLQRTSLQHDVRVETCFVHLSIMLSPKPLECVGYLETICQQINDRATMPSKSKTALRDEIKGTSQVAMQDRMSEYRFSIMVHEMLRSPLQVLTERENCVVSIVDLAGRILSQTRRSEEVWNEEISLPCKPSSTVFVVVHRDAIEAEEVPSQLTVDIPQLSLPPSVLAGLGYFFLTVEVNGVLKARSRCRTLTSQAVNERITIVTGHGDNEVKQMALTLTFVVEGSKFSGSVMLDEIWIGMIVNQQIRLTCQRQEDPAACASRVGPAAIETMLQVSVSLFKDVKHSREFWKQALATSSLHLGRYQQIVESGQKDILERNLPLVLPLSSQLLPPFSPLILSIFLHRAIDLRAADRNGLSDPYVLISLVDCCDHKRVLAGPEKSKIVMKTLSPVWEQLVEIPLTSLDADILIEVYDHDVGPMSDDRIGKLVLPVSALDEILHDRLTGVIARHGLFTSKAVVQQAQEVRRDSSPRTKKIFSEAYDPR
eukprot:768459-Hanusia_phi.AAC.8